MDAAVSVNLDVIRNELIRMEMLLTIGTFAAAACAVPAGMFGMNLTSHMEDSPHAFLITVIAIATAGICQFGLLVMYGRKRGIL